MSSSIYLFKFQIAKNLPVAQRRTRQLIVERPRAIFQNAQPRLHQKDGLKHLDHRNHQTRLHYTLSYQIRPIILLRPRPNRNYQHLQKPQVMWTRWRRMIELESKKSLHPVAFVTHVNLMTLTILE